ncbi:MAG: M2 family metallopeptidase [Acidobacteria bacterium]|nr:M2 family metallopeptidase [Acidobacteriota bacterium]
MTRLDMETVASKWIDRHVKLLEPLHRNTCLAHWTASISGRSEDYQQAAALQIEFRKLYSDTQEFIELKRLRDSREVMDPLLRRQLDLLYLEYLGNQIPQNLMEPMVRKAMEAESVFNTFRARLDGREVTDNQLRDILRHENSSEKRRAAWEASKQVGATVADLLREVVKMRNQAAQHLGFKNFYNMSIILQEQDVQELSNLFDELASNTDAPFRQAKSEIDAALSKRFGVPVADLMPWHYSDPFFQEAPFIVDYDLDNPFKGRDVVGLSRDFFRHIGLAADDVLEDSDLYEKKGKEQHAYCIDIDRHGDVRILANVRDNEQWMGTMLHELGHAIYDKNIDPNLPYVLRMAAHTLTTEAVAMFFGRRSRCQEFARLLLKLPAAEARKYGKAGQRMLRYDLMVLSRWVQVMMRFEKGLYENPDRDLNALWWDLVERYQGLRRPKNRKDGDWSSKIHIISHPVYYHNYMLGEMLASQMQRALARHLAGGPAQEEYARAFVDEPKAGAYLSQRMLNQGARMHWRELVVHVTGKTLSSDCFAAQFMPASA